MGKLTGVVVAAVIIAATLSLGLWLKGGSNKQAASLPADQNAAITEQEGDEKMQMTDLKVGEGAEAVTGNSVSVHYTGTLENGTKFDSSVDRGQPFEFKLGASQVIQGWDQGVVGMKVGGKRKLVIPPELAYGSQSPSPLIPANSTLVFEIELLEVR
jgi:FKBP-type peptidyl-prolyl cis-trans isomerase